VNLAVDEGPGVLDESCDLRWNRKVHAGDHTGWTKP
jgi:hypothetical protein